MNFIYLLSFVLAFCALLYELLIARVVSLWAVNNTVWYALVVGIFIGGMGTGAWLTERGQKVGAAWPRLFRIELWLVFAGGLCVLAVYAAGLAGLYLGLCGFESWGRILFFGTAFVAALSVGVGAGMELPLLLSMADEQAPGVSGEKAGAVLFMDYAGSLAAGLAFPLVIIPWMSVMAAAALVACVNGMAALGLLWHYRSASGHKRAWSLVFLMAAFYCVSPGIEGYFTSKYYFSFQDDLALAMFFKPRVYPGRVERLRSPYQILDLVVADDIGPDARGLLKAYIKGDPSDDKSLEGMVLFLNNDFQFAASFERIYHETFAHVPVAVLGRVPESVLILGGGDGLLLREVLKYPGVRQVVLVDIDPKVLGAFKNVRALASLNHNALRDPRVTVVTQDAYQYVRRPGESYEMVFCDFPNPDDYDLAKLYSREFYRFLRSHVKPGGLVAVDAPGLSQENGGESRGMWAVLSNTLQAAGFASVRPFFSQLEEDNKEALSLMEGNKEALHGYVDGLTSGFLMAFVDQGPSGEPRPLNVAGLRVINDARVRLSLERAARFSFYHDPVAVNSILRPLFPLRGDSGKIRSAY
ncbi:MAG: hypothetical protein WCO69_03500 [Candidatus Omnitrophota bacterium]